MFFADTLAGQLGPARFDWGSIRMARWDSNRSTHRAVPDLEPHERTPDDNCGPDKCLDCGRRGCALCDNPCPGMPEYVPD